MVSSSSDEDLVLLALSKRKKRRSPIRHLDRQCELLRDTENELKMDVKSVLHKHCDWLLRLFAAQKFGRLNLDPTNKALPFRSGIFTFCVKTLVLNQFFCMKKASGV